MADGKPVKYILTETSSNQGPYYVSYTDLTGGDNAFEQTNPSGKSGTPGASGTNEAKFILNENGIVIDVNNANNPYICKIVEHFGTELAPADVEVPFRTLNKAVSFARDNLGGTATIEMLMDYCDPRRHHQAHRL
jgi:hypothetical protein